MSGVYGRVWSSRREVALDGVDRLSIASGAGEDEGALKRSKQHRRLLGRLRGRVSELDVDAGDCGLIAGEQFADVDAEVGVGGNGVDDGCSQWTAEAKSCSTSRYRQGATISPMASGKVSASLSVRSSSTKTSARARSIASVMSCVLPPGK